MKASIAFLVSMVSCISAVRAQDCETRSSDLGNFARFPIGLRLKALPEGVKREPNCTVYRKYHTFDCGFTDKDGSSFIASGHGIVRVERKLQGSSKLPEGYPLKPGMSADDVTKVLSVINPTIKVRAFHSDQGDFLMTPECFKNRYGAYYLSIGFDTAGGLNGLVAAFDTPEN